MITNADIGKPADVDLPGGRCVEATVMGIDGDGVIVGLGRERLRVPRAAVHVVEPAAFDARQAFAALTDEQRKQVTAGYCKSCWTPDPRCQCWNDE